MLFGGAVARGTSDEPAATRPALNVVADFNWLDSLDAAYLQAQRTGQPILVLVEDRSLTTGEWANDAVASLISRDPVDAWVPVRLDLRQSRDAVAALGIAMTPAICVLSVDGRVVGTKQGRLNDATLPEWITSMRAMATSGQPPQSPTRQANIADLASQDESIREMAVRRLEDDRGAAGQIVDVLFDGPMSARLAAMDLLEQWQSPLGGIDPWNPSTLTPVRREALEAWGRSGAPASRPSEIQQSASSIAGLDIEMDALLNAPTDIEARQIREQMAHFGPAGLPSIRRRIKTDSSDADRQRLVALRYRLVASNRLAEQWPGGFDRLASTDAFVRRTAVDELSKLVGGEDSPLLIELFSDEDEFVRERSLRMLRSVGGAQSTKALIDLLDDPEPNVRAAVLKTLGENPDPSMASDLARYVRSEKDADLVVHCIGVLEGIPGDEAVNCLKDLLHHPAWRVRAEACGAIHQKMQAREQMEPAQIASLVDALRKCLDDPDDFVVSQAAIALVSFNVSPANLAVMNAMDRHPSLGLDVLNSVGRDRDSTVMLLPAIRKLLTNPKPQIRAAAIRAVCQFAPEAAGREVAVGLKDPDATVRQEAATGLATALEESFPDAGTVYSEPGNYQSTRETVDVEQWVRDFIAGSRRPTWMIALKPDLEKMIADPDEQTRVAAAMSLCALGGADEAWPVLQRSADSELARGTETAALPWLDWDRRKMLWDRLAAITPDGQMPRLIEQFSAVPDQRAVMPLWDLLRDPPRDGILAAVNGALEGLYGVGNAQVVNILGQPSSPTAHPDKCLADANAVVNQGGELQKVQALCLIMKAAPNEVAKPAAEVYENKTNSTSLRTDALQILLLSQPKDKAVSSAVEALSDPAMRKVGVSYLALGNQAVCLIRKGIYLNPMSAVNEVQYGGVGQIIEVPVPAGLNASIAEKLLTDDDEDVAGCAGYLLTIMGDHRGLASLLRALESHGFQDDDWRALAYRGIAKLDDDSQTPTLQRIYESFAGQTWEIRQFYWTIRAMHGPNILKLRKKIRDEIGMQQLQ
jgi:HEAT repeat protein